MEPTNDILIDSADEMYRLLLPHAAKMREETEGTCQTIVVRSVEHGAVVAPCAAMI